MFGAVLSVASRADELGLAPRVDQLNAAADYSAAHHGQSMIVMFDGAVIFERYDNGGRADRLQMLASGTKSFIGIIAAAAVEDGILQLDDPACDSIESWKDDPPKNRITYRQLLTLTSGLKPASRGLAMKQPGWEAMAAEPMTGHPGRQFGYGANQLNVFAYCLERSLAGETFENYLKRRIFKPLSIEIDWRVRCVDGHPQVGGGGFMTSRDWTGFGEFIRLGGRVGKKQIIASQLIADCFVGTAPNPAYGMTWWLRTPVTREHSRASRILASEWAEAANADWLPSDLVAACGAGKQRLYVVPSLRMVVVRQATLPNRDFSDTKFLKMLFG